MNHQPCHRQQPFYNASWSLLMPMMSIVWCVNMLQEKSPSLDVITRAFVAADMPVTKNPNGHSISDNKRPDGLTLLPWQEGKPLAWDVTVKCPLAVSYVSGYSAGASAELAASRKCEKYAICPTPTFASH